MGAKGNQKGKRAERELCSVLEDLGLGEWRRSQQYTGAEVEGAGDVVPVEGDETAETFAAQVRLECKRRADHVKTRSAKMQRWIETAREETPKGKLAVVAFRADRSGWELLFDFGPMTVRTPLWGGSILQIEALFERPDLAARGGKLVFVEPPTSRADGQRNIGSGRAERLRAAAEEVREVADAFSER
jgi:Holliday junction resolvase